MEEYRTICMYSYVVCVVYVSELCECVMHGCMGVMLRIGGCPIHFDQKKKYVKKKVWLI
ncbi:uncharacterized protein DS421_10g304920 [Arachis hypogaea]|nr:uncharacterized protein DS421_10g304920 [Arachis hypogaea]